MKKHEQALLVVLSYVIGFTTAFIIFGFGDQDETKTYSQPAAGVGAELVGNGSIRGIEVIEVPEGLFVKMNGHDRILSAQTEADSADIGFHTDIASSSVSPNGQYVYYCAEMEAAFETCQHFVYSVSEDATYMVKDGEEPLVTADTEASTVSWSGNSELRLGGRLASQASLWSLE